MDEIIYLDNNATTPIDPRVLEAMLPFMKGLYGNAASAHHFGQTINKAVNQAREKVAELINAEPKEIIFTSGATESINLALKGLALHPANSKRHIVTVQTEHKAILDVCAYLESIGFWISYLPVMSDGRIDMEVLRSSITNDTFLIAVMLVNNETGVIQDLKQITSIAHNKGIKVLTDATQAVGKMQVDVLDFEVDLLTFSAHKMYGPKGIGALYVKSGIKLNPLIHGGGHEQGLRSGTLNVPGIIGLGEACSIALMEMEQDKIHIRKLRDDLENELLKISGTSLNGNKEQRLFNVCNICFPGLDANSFIANHKNIAISNGSACTSGLVKPSHVLSAMNITINAALDSVRISIGKFNNKNEIQSVINNLKQVTINP